MEDRCEKSHCLYLNAQRLALGATGVDGKKSSVHEDF